MTERQDIFLKLLEPVNNQLARFCRAMARDREEARDLASEAILRAYENFNGIEKQSSFKSYIFTIASRLHKQKLRRLKFIGSYDEAKAELIPSDSGNPDTQYDVQVLYDAMDKLPRKQREAIALFEISGFSLKEIRDLQGGSLSGVKIRLKRARDKLAELLEAGVDPEKKARRIELMKPSGNGNKSSCEILNINDEVNLRPEGKK